MENFIVSARKYRPVTFDSVVGQDTVTNTLKNAIKSNHLSQAYLFCGPRGVGKTTCARILAKTINCENITEDIEACDQCESCKSFNESRSFNIHELDAASNNSVDDIRSLIDQVRIPPQVGNFSIYIIDEIHMLSAQAFNAFLKTLEEPPKHAVYILATTEKHKIIPTILSRCQIFDFNRIKLDDITGRLQYVAEQEGITAEEDALHIIAQKADGAMRDALSIFDQIVSYSGFKITYQNVIENLNVLDFEYYFKLTDAFLSGDSSNSLLILDEIIMKGFDPHQLITGLSSHLRDLLVCKDPETIQLLETGASFQKRYLTQAEKTSADFLFQALDILSSADVQFRINKNQRLHTELNLIKLCRLTTENTGTEKKTEPVKIQSVEDKEPKTSVVPKPEPDVHSLQAERSAGSEPKKVRETKTGYEPRTTSIKDGLKGAIGKNRNGPAEDLEKPEKKEKSLKEEPFTITELQEKWMEYSDRIKTDKPRLATTIKAQLPNLKDNFKIIVEMENTSQMNDFRAYVKSDLLDYLKENLNNDYITLETILSEKVDEERKPYTDEEKFKFMSEKNPNLKTLKKQFGLDFE